MKKMYVVLVILLIVVVACGSTKGTVIAKWTEFYGNDSVNYFVKIRYAQGVGYKEYTCKVSAKAYNSVSVPSAQKCSCRGGGITCESAVK